MKKLIIFLLLISGLLVWQSCKDDEPRPEAIIDMTEAIAPELIGPFQESHIVLIADTIDIYFPTFEWSSAVYNSNSLSDVNYLFKMIYNDSSIIDSKVLESTKDLIVVYTLDEFNKTLKKLGLNVDEEDTVQFQVVSSITTSTETDDLVSELLTLYLTPYKDSVSVIPVETLDKSIYLLGDATVAGWDNVLAIEMTQITPGRYVIVATLNQAGDWYKFISVRGQWAPQWGTDGDGVFEGGNLVYRPTEDDPDPAAIPMGDVGGVYRIIADTNETVLTYSTEEYAIVDPFPSEMFLVGAATTAGWDNANGLAFTQDSVGYYSLVTELVAGGGGMKILGLSGAWAPQWGTVSNANPEGDILIYRPTEDITDPSEIPAPESDGTYKISINLHVGIYQITLE